MELVATEGSAGVGQLMVDIVAGLVEVVGEKRTTDDERVHLYVSLKKPTMNFILLAGRIVSAGRCGTGRVSLPDPLARLTNARGEIIYVPLCKVRPATALQTTRFVAKETKLLQKKENKHE
jgi:hypothetical protein